MKRIISGILATALLLALLPTGLAGDVDTGNAGVTLVYNFNSGVIVGNSTGVLRDTALYDEYSEIDTQKSAPWAYVKDTCYSRNLLAAHFSSPGDHRRFGTDRQPFYALKIKVSNFGEYYLSVLPMLVNFGSKTKVYIVPYVDEDVTRETFSSATPIGEFDTYSTATKWTAGTDTRLGKVNIPTGGEYLLIFDIYGNNENATYNSTNYSSLAVASATLTAAPPTAGAFDILDIAVDGVSDGAPMPLDTVKPIVHTLKDANNITIENPTYTAVYESSDEAVATVDDDGNITAVACGDAEITASVTFDGIMRSDTYNLTVAEKGENLMAERNPDFENDEWYWGIAREDTAPDTPKFMRIMIGEQATTENADNRALGIIMNPEVAAIKNPAPLMLKTDGSRIKLKAGNFYRASFKLKLDYKIPSGASDIQLILDTFGYINETGNVSSALAGDLPRTFAAQLSENYHEKYAEWNEIVLPICAPITPVSEDNLYIYATPRIVLRPVEADLARAGYDGTIWIDDIEICEVGYSGVDVGVTGDLSSIEKPLQITAKPYASTGEYISLNSTCVPDCVTFSTTDESIASLPSNTARTQAAKSDGKYYITAETKLGGKRGTASISADVTLSGIKRMGKADVTPENLPLVLLYANATAENPSLKVGESTRILLDGTMSDETASDLSGALCFYKSSDKTIAEVSQDGTVKAKSAGSAVITATINLDGTAVEATAAITVTDDSRLSSLTLSGNGSVGYLRDTQLVLKGKMSSGYDANMSLAMVEYIVESDPVGAVTVSADGKVFGATMGGTAQIHARAVMNSGEPVISNTVNIAVTESDLRDVTINFNEVNPDIIPEPAEAILSRDGWQLNTVLTGRNGMKSIFIMHGLQMIGSSSDTDIAFDIDVPYEGVYSLIIQGYLGSSGATSEVYLDGMYVGEYSFYNSISATGTSKSLGSVGLKTGTHTVLLRATDNTGYYQYPEVIRLRALHTLPKIEGINATAPSVLVVGDTAALDASILTEDGFEVKPHKTLDGNTDPNASITYESSNAEIASVDATGNITAVANGDAVITITATANGDTKTRDIPVTVDGSVVDTVKLATDRRIFYTGERAELGVKATLASGAELSADKMSIVWSSDNTNVAEFSGNTLIAKTVGSANIKGVVTYYGGTAEVTEEITVEEDVFGIVSVTAPTLLMRPDSDGITLAVSATTYLGTSVDLSGAQIAFESGDESIVTVDGNGHVTPVALGETTVSASVMLGGKTVVGEANVTVRNGKVARTYYTDEMAANAQENVKKYDWARDLQKTAVRVSEKYLGNEEQLWKMVTGEGLPRSHTAGAQNDPEARYCRYCGVNLQPDYGTYPWIVNPLSRPWKIQCPSCRRIFPSNDFGSFYELGLDEHGIFDRNLAHERNAELGEDAGYLRNVLYPEAEEKFGDKNWGVDDGFGYDTGKTYSSGVKEIHEYIAYYNNWGLWCARNSMPAYITNALINLSTAYVYTGDAKYGRVGAILLDRVADVYPGFDWSPYYIRFQHSQGGTGRGKILGNIWETTLAEDFAKAYDAFFPMYDDPYVVSFLADKAAKYKLANDKSTPAKIRENCETGILREIYDATKKNNIGGNFGMKQSTLATAAVVLDTQPETNEYIDFVFRTGITSGEVCTGGSVNERLVDQVSRDGQGNESAPGYNRIWVTQLTSLANTLGRYDGYDDMALYDNPKFLKMIKSYSPMTLVRRGLPAIGDSGLTAGFSVIPDSPDVLTDSFKYTGDIQIAQHMYWVNGNSAENLHYDVFEKNPESLSTEVKRIIDTYGEYDFDRSDLLSGYGLSVLRGGSRYDSVGAGGAIDNQRDFWMYFGGAISHCHEDALNLGLEAFGISFSSDLGYPEATGTDPNRLQWQNTSLAHNTIVVDSQSQIPLREAATPLHFDNTDRVRVMDIDAPEVYATTDIYRRTVVMVDYDADNSYGLDFFRVKGGDDHLYSFHASSEDISSTSDNLDFVAQAGGTYAGATASFGEDPYTVSNSRMQKLKYPTGYTWLENVRRADAPGVNEFFVDFKIKDFRNFLGGTKKDMHLRVTMLNDFNLDEVTLATGMPPRTPSNTSCIKHLQYMLARRSGANLDSLFTTVLEPYDSNRYITNLEQVPTSVSEGTEKSGDYIKAVKVTLANGRTDYVVYATNNTVKYTIDGKFDFRGFVGVYSLNADGKNIYSYIHDGDVIGENKELDAALEGTVTDFTKELSFDNTITVSLDSDTTADSLSDKVIFVENDGVQNASYTIKSAEMTDARTAKLNLGDVTLIRKYIDSSNEELGYEYNIAKGQSFTIPLSYTENAAPIFNPVSYRSVSAGTVMSQTVYAESPSGGTVKYAARNLPRGASLDTETGEFSWKPDSSQIGENAVAIDAIDAEGRVSTVYFTLKVLGATTGGTAGGGGGGGGGTTPTEPTNPTEPTEPKPVDPTPTEPTEPVTPPATGNGFTDLGGYDWARDAINALAEDGIIKGVGEDMFAPGANITRADFAILLVRAFKLTSESGDNFADVSPNDYFAGELAIAKSAGIIGGIGDNKYAPRNKITREDMMVIVYRALTKLGYTLSDSEEITDFADAGEISDYALDAVATLIANDVISGANGKINPKSATTRAEVAVLLKRILDLGK